VNPRVDGAGRSDNHERRREQISNRIPWTGNNEKIPKNPRRLRRGNECNEKEAKNYKNQWKRTGRVWEGITGLPTQTKRQPLHHHRGKLSPNNHYLTGGRSCKKRERKKSSKPVLQGRSHQGNGYYQKTSKRGPSGWPTDLDEAERNGLTLPKETGRSEEHMETFENQRKHTGMIGADPLYLKGRGGRRTKGATP